MKELNKRREDEKTKGLYLKALDESVYVTDGFDAYRTEPPQEEGEPFNAFVKTNNGEERVSHQAHALVKLLLGEEIQEEITEKKYNDFTPKNTT